MAKGNEAHHFAFDNDDCTLILDAPPITSPPTPYVIPKDFNFSTKTCYIYAEDILLSADLHLPGKTLGLFCNTLIIPTVDPVTKNAIITTIDVSGSNGTSNPTDSDLRDGGDGGRIYIYVENMNNILLENLRLVSKGGDGATGMDNAAGVGGDGGNGGAGGTINFIFGSIFNDIGIQVFNTTSLSWVTQVNKVIQSIMPAINLETVSDSTSFGYPSDMVTSWNTIFTSYSGWASALGKLQASLNSVLSPPAGSGGSPDATTVGWVSECLQIIKTTMDLTASSVSVRSSTTEIDAVENAVISFLKIGGKKKQSELVNAIDEAVHLGGIRIQKSDNGHSELSTAIQQILNTSVGLLESISNNIERNSADTSEGKKGMGGRSSPGTTPPDGISGDDGNPGTVKAQYLGFDGRKSDCDVEIPYAFPEQCRMLLNIADANYFVDDQNSWTIAAKIYNRLKRRLSFMGGISKDSNLAKAYASLEAEDGVTYKPLPEIQSIYVAAQKRLNQLALGYDMFGHSASWVPRLSAEYYKGRVTDMLKQLKSLEDAVNKYEAANQSEAEKRKQAEVGTGNSSLALSNAEDLIAMLSGPKGRLRSYINQINTYAPLLGPAREAILTAMKKVTSDIQNAINVNPEDIINAFTTLAMCPSKIMAVAELGSEIYKAATTVTGADGADVNKSYVIQRLSTCGDTLKSLHEAFKQNKDGTIDLNDPGASMVLAQKADIEKLIKEFASAIPEKDGQAVKDALQTYTTLISKRNTAVVEYNCSLQLLAQAINDRDDYNRQVGEWGETLLTLPTDIPAIILWLRKSRDDLQFGIMQRLNFESRAIYFWGLASITIMDSPGPLMNSLDLGNDQNKLDTSTETAMDFLSRSSNSIFPDTGKPGSFYKISDDDLDSLKQNPTQILDPNDKTKVLGKIWSTTIAIAQGDIPGLALDLNIRLSEVRVWLIGVQSSIEKDPEGNQPFNLSVTQSGTETIQDTAGNEIKFTHDPVTVTFEYYCNRVKKYQDCLRKNMWSIQGMGGDFDGVTHNKDTTAPIGPYSDWTIKIKSEGSMNPGLNLDNVTEAYFEFAGRHWSPSPRPRPVLMSNPTVTAGQEQQHQHHHYHHHHTYNHNHGKMK
ncbi:hypothetical protein ABW20_dc0105091 [Dactylellina cionopaga]|nr:hypothetical protein ABW20_dc0105091 [Dactylellina cionopaga]